MTNISADDLSALGSPIVLIIKGSSAQPYWSRDDVNEILDTFDPKAYVVYERNANGSWCITEIRA